MPIPSPFLSVIIPAYNEEKRIGASLSRIVAFLDKRYPPYELIVVNDGSTDATLSIVQHTIGHLPQIRILDNGTNRGKGYSVRRGLLEGKGQYLLFTDADLSTPIEEAENIIKWLKNGYDICIASRAVPDAHILRHQPFYREWMGKIFNCIVRMTLMLPFSDTQCGFKGFRADVVQHLAPLLRVDRFGFDVELLYVARKSGYRVKETGVSWMNSPATKVGLLGDPLKMLGAIPKIYLNQFSGRYVRIPPSHQCSRKRLNSRDRLL